MKKYALTGLIFGLIPLAALAQGSSELTCRAQAKEVAAQAYSSCITDARNSQIDEIRKNYQKELADIKNKYDQELKKLGAGIPPQASNQAAKRAQPQASIKTSNKKVRPLKEKALARKLPSKSGPAQEALPVQSAQNENLVVAVRPESPSDVGLENEAAAADQIEIVEMPADE